MQTLLMLQGLPGSGKSSYAADLCQRDPSFTVVNKDAIRERLKREGITWSHKNEIAHVLPARDAAIVTALQAGLSVVVDDTNLATKHVETLRKLAQAHGAAFQIHRLEVSLDECIRRDAARGEKRVGADIIRGMAAQYLAPDVVPYVVDMALPWAVLCDLDGTLALSSHHRGPYEHEKCADDEVNPAVAMVLSMAVSMNTVRTFAMLSIKHGFSDPLTVKIAEAKQMHIIFLTGRMEKYRPQTMAFLERTRCNAGPLFMRATGDSRADHIVKSELFDQHVRGKYNVAFVLDDRNSVVAQWRRMGLTCLQVADGAF